MRSVDIGDKFRVRAETPVSVTDGKGRKRTLANYLPEFEYGVTSRNVGVVNQMIADEKADRVDGVAARTNQLEPKRPATMAGHVTVGKKGRK